jgi:hypothetical protein
MLKMALGAVVLIAQLSNPGRFAQLKGPGDLLPQIVRPGFTTSGPLRAGAKGGVTVSFEVLKGYAVNHTPSITLKLTTVRGVVLEKLDFSSPSPDPKSKNEYYVDLPTLQVPVLAPEAGNYEIPGKLKYYFCSTEDGFCSTQTIDVKIPILVQ